MEFNDLLQKIAETLELKPEFILEPSRHRVKVEARYILYLILDKQNEHPAAIALRFKQDRTTVVNGLQKAYYLKENERFFKAKYEKCSRAVQNKDK